jgi:hypothetical protein
LVTEIEAVVEGNLETLGSRLQQKLTVSKFPSLSKELTKRFQEDVEMQVSNSMRNFARGIQSLVILTLKRSYSFHIVKPGLLPPVQTNYAI